MILKNYIKLSKLAVKNLDKLLDINFYPTDKTETSNNKHRPIGLGIARFSRCIF